MWYNEGLRRWALWSLGSDAPPLPVEWKVDDGGASRSGAGAAGVAGEAGGRGEGDSPDQPGPGTGPGNGAGPSPGGRQRPGLLRYLPDDAMARRPPMKSPYRVVPIVIVVLVVAIAVYQATRPLATATKRQVAAAMSLEGHCLVRDGGTPEYPDFSPTPVSCSSTKAAAKVVEVVLPGKSAACPPHTVAVRVVGAALQGEPVECLAPVHSP